MQAKPDGLQKIEVCLPDSMADRLRQEATITGINISAFVRLALTELFNIQDSARRAMAKGGD